MATWQFWTLIVVLVALAADLNWRQDRAIKLIAELMRQIRDRGH